MHYNSSASSVDQVWQTESLRVAPSTMKPRKFRVTFKF